MSQDLLALAPFHLHRHPLLTFHASIHGDPEEPFVPPPPPLSRSAACPPDGGPHKVVQILYDEVCEEVVLLTSEGLLCFYPLRASRGPSLGTTTPPSPTSDHFTVPLERSTPAQAQALEAGDQREGRWGDTSPLAFARRCPWERRCPSSFNLVAAGDGKAGSGHVSFLLSSGITGGNGNGNPHPEYLARGRYVCAPHNLRFPSGTSYPILDVHWLPPAAAAAAAPISSSSSSSTARVGLSSPVGLVCVTPISLEVLSLSVNTDAGLAASRKEREGRLEGHLLQRYTTRTDLWFTSASAGLLWSVNASKANVIKPFLLSPPAAAGKRGGGASVRPCPKLQLPTSGQELFAPATKDRRKDTLPLPLLGTMSNMGPSVCPAGHPQHLVGALTLYEDEIALFHTRLDLCRIVLYRYHGPSRLHEGDGEAGGSTGVVGADAYTVLAVLSLVEFPSARDYARQFSRAAGITAHAAAATTFSSAIPPCLVVQTIDNAIFLHCPSDQLTSVFDTSVGYQRTRERRPHNGGGGRGEGGTAYSPETTGQAGGRGAEAEATQPCHERREPQSMVQQQHHHLLSWVSAAAAADASSDPWDSDHIWGSARGQHTDDVAGGSSSSNDIHGLGLSAQGGPTRGYPRRRSTTQTPPPPPPVPVPVMGEDAATWLATSLDHSEVEVLMPLLTASLNLFPPSAPPLGQRQAGAHEGFGHDQVRAFSPAHSRLPLRFSLSHGDDDRQRRRPHTVAVRLLDLNPISVALTSSLAEPQNVAMRLSFLLRRRAFLHASDAHKRAVVGILLSSLAGRSPSLTSLSGTTATPLPSAYSFSEAVGALEATAWYGAWARAKNEKRKESGECRGSRPDVDVGSEEPPGNSAIPAPLSISLVPPDAASTRYDNLTQEDVVQQLIPAFLGATTAAARSAQDTPQYALQVRQSLAAFWGVAAYVNALLLSGEVVEEVALLALLDASAAVVTTAATAAAAAAKVAAPHISEPLTRQSHMVVDVAVLGSLWEEAAMALMAILSSLPLCSASPQVGSRLIELSCCYAEYNDESNASRLGEHHHGTPPPATTAAIQSCGLLLQETMYRHGMSILKRTASADAVVEAVQSCLQHQQPLTATRVLRDYMGYVHLRQSGNQSKDGHHGGGEGDEAVLGECMHVVLRGAAEAVDARALAHYMHTMAHRHRRCEGNADTGPPPQRDPAEVLLSESVEQTACRLQWETSCLVFMRCFEEIAALLLLLTHNSPLDGDGGGETDGHLAFSGVPKGMAGFTERYNRLAEMF